MIALSLPALQMLQNLATQDATFPAELTQRLQHLSADSAQNLEITEETAHSLLDLLPPPHTITDPILLEISTTFRTFIADIQAKKPVQS